MTNKKFKFATIGIDASRSTSGGAIEHLRGILLSSSLELKKIDKVYVWAPNKTLNLLPNFIWLKKKSIDHIGHGILKKVLWQFFILPKLCKKFKVNLLFNTSSGSVCNFKPSLTLVQNILPFEKEINLKHGYFNPEFYRNILLKFINIRCLNRTNHIIFLSKYSQKVVSRFIESKNSTIIPHGFDKSFYEVGFKKINKNKKRHINILYVSNALIYKNQWNVIAAIAEIKKRYNLNIKLKIVGGGSGLGLKKMNQSKIKYDANDEFINLVPFSTKSQIKKDYKNSHIFIFASTCEAFGITLLEAMSTGIPVVCSNKSSLPEIIKENTIYFDPENVEEIINSIIKIYEDDNLRLKLSKYSKIRSEDFSWKKTSDLTWKTLYEVFKKVNKY